ncbi:S16 family serine protease [Paenibacillus arenilitoris]|uniref:endopeptidase La n=1 Tax=Paenibacillus arenilitoris TaxID=2772299 RepID=A0A927H7Q4_9BACL|nr:S16 family serine protease [Paenibacillus arenilitoris]MBD2870782.1 hypothetical protein [Paenibacillus arenilitoris]
MRSKLSEVRRIFLIALSTAAAMWVLLYAPTPYVVYEPGIAVPVRPMIAAEDGDPLGEGDFLLTAVKLTEPNFLGAVRAMWDRSKDVYSKRDVFRGYTEQQYVDRLSVIMEGSQNNAVEAAYRYAKLPYKTKVRSIVVSDVASGDQALVKTFKSGDKLLGLSGGKRFASTDDVLAALEGLDKSAKTAFDVERGGEVQSVPIYAGAFQASMDAEQKLKALGIFALTELRSLEPADGRNRLTIAAGEIGGPSAGLVFALQAIDLLTEGDLSGGRTIAATGTITAEGKIGAIGGIKQKIVKASEEGAQLFLAPADNAAEARTTAKSIGASMKVEAVDTLEQALDRIEAFNMAENRLS